MAFNYKDGIVSAPYWLSRRHKIDCSMLLSNGFKTLSEIVPFVLERPVHFKLESVHNYV
jgi:hypothetical protein